MLKPCDGRLSGRQRIVSSTNASSSTAPMYRVTGAICRRDRLAARRKPTAILAAVVARYCTIERHSSAQRWHASAHCWQ